MDYNRREPKYERRMLMGGSAKDWGSRRRVLVWGYTNWGGRTHRYSNILVAWETCILTFRESPITTLQPK